MATPFKSFYSFDNIVKKYTLCGQCDGKLSDKPFFICGCNEILCVFCSEKHSCGLHQQAIKYANYKHCKSINFIHDLLEVVHNNHEKEKEKKIAQDYDNLYSTFSCLPDLDELVKNETQEVSFSQFFDEDHCSRTEKPRATYSNSKRKPVSSKIKYSLKRKQFISDSEDEDNSDKVGQISPNNSATSENKKVIKKRKKYSNKSRESNFDSTIHCDSKLSDKQHCEKKINSTVVKDSSLISISLSENTNTNFLSIASPLLLEDHGECSIDQNTSSPVGTGRFNNNYKTDNKPRYCKESRNDKYSDSLCNKNKRNVVSNDNVIVNIESALKNEHSFKREDKCTKPQLFNLGGIDDNFVELKTLEDHIIENNVRNEILKPNNYECNVKQRDYKTVNCDIKPSNKQNKPVSAIKKQIGHNVSNIISSNSKDFDGFDQCEINASTLNYMLYKLTTPSNGSDEMVFPMNYQGRMFFFHTGQNIKDSIIGNGHHFLVTRIPEAKSDNSQTLENENIHNNKGNENGPSKIHQTKDSCDGPDGAISKFTQTNSYHVADASIGTEGKLDAVIQTDGYQINNISTCPITYITTMSQTDPVTITPIIHSSDLSVHSDESSHGNLDHPIDKLHLDPPSVEPESAQSMNYFTIDSPSKGIGSSDNEDEEIIEGTPVKTSNLSFSSLDLSVMKERTLHFDLTSTSPIKRDEVVSCSDLLNEDKHLVQEFCRTYGIEYTEYFTNITTHLVVSSRLSYESHKTFKYLMAIASKAAVTSMLWVTESLLAKKVLPVDKYIATNYPGPARCITNAQPPFSGLSIYSKLMRNYPGTESIEALCKLCGAFVMDDIEQDSVSGKWPYPRFCLFEDESHLTSRVLNSCSKNFIVAISYVWIYESIAAYKRLPILKHLCSTFILTDDIVEAYRIPSDLITDNTN